MDKEKQAFASRLRVALGDAGIEVSAAALEKQFNRRYQGTPVTAQAISGWLTGRHMPKQDKIRVLASLLGIDLQDLLLGEDSGHRAEQPPGAWQAVAARDRQVIDAFLALTPKRRELVGELVAELGKPPNAKD